MHGNYIEMTKDYFDKIVSKSNKIRFKEESVSHTQKGLHSVYKGLPVYINNDLTVDYRIV